jgi:hypothetical protein
MQAQTLTGRRPTPLAGNTDTNYLKLVALAFMMIDHLGAAVFVTVPEMRILGRIAMPLYAWCLVVGCEYTHDIQKYALRLLLMAVISQPINMVALSNQWDKLNILFLLCLGVVAIAGIKKKRYGSQIWVPLLCYVFLGFVNVDYGWKGLTFLLLLYAARNSRGGLAAAFLAFALYWGTSGTQISSVAGVQLDFLNWPVTGPVLKPFFHLQTMMWLALPFLMVPTRTGIRLPKWLGYGFYPLHLLLIILIRLAMGDTLTGLLSVF